MSTTRKFDQVIVEAFAEAWASMDGKFDLFIKEKELPASAPTTTGTYEGYMADAYELLSRAERRITAFKLNERLAPLDGP